MGSAVPKLLLQLELPHPTICSPYCHCFHYLSSCSNDPSLACLPCRTLPAPCQHFLHRSFTHLHQCSAPQILQCRHSHCLHEALCGRCCSSMSDLAAEIPREEDQIKHASACDHHGQALASYLCFSTKNNSSAAGYDQPIITAATPCKTPEPADSCNHFCCSRRQDDNEAEMRWWEAAGLKGSSVCGDEAADHCYTWPPRAYACTFCRRMFVSAQALGGHMNVHRHERARLRQFSQPNIDATAASAMIGHTTTVPSMLLPLPASYPYMHADTKPCHNHTMKMSSSIDDEAHFLSPLQQHGFQATKNFEKQTREESSNERRKIELPISSHVHAQFLVNNSQSTQEVSFVDLELRLGHLAYH